MSTSGKPSALRTLLALPLAAFAVTNGASRAIRKANAPAAGTATPRGAAWR